MDNQRHVPDGRSTALVTRARAVERALARARRPVVARMRAVARRVDAARRSLDVAAIIREHPRTTAGVAVAAGLIIGLARTGARRTLPGRVAMIVGGIALRAAASALGGWIAETVRKAPGRRTAASSDARAG